MENNQLDLKWNPECDETKHKCVVRLTSSRWQDHRGYHIKRSLVYLRRQCRGVNILEEDSKFDPYAISIVNLHECRDGIYEVVLCNESYDWETGNLEDYGFKLVKIEA